VKKRHLEFLNQQKMNHAALLLTGMPELEGRPLSHWWAGFLGRFFSIVRRGFEQLLTEVAFVFPWMARVLRSGFVSLRLSFKRTSAIFPLEVWLSLGLFAGTGLLLVW